MKKVFRVIILVLLVSSVLIGSSIKIGVVLPMTGGVSSFGQMLWEGIKTAKELQPKVLGYDVELILLDNKSDKVESANAFRRLIEKEKVIAVLGDLTSSQAIAGAAVSEELKTPQLTPSASSPLVTAQKKYVSRVCFADPFQGEVAAKFTVDSLKLTKVAMFMDVEQDYAVGLAKYFEKTFVSKGGKIIRELYKSGDQDFTAQISDAMSKGAQAFFIPGYYQEIALIAIQAKQAGFEGALVTGDGADAAETIEIGKDAVNGLYLTAHYHQDSPAANKNAEMFLQKFSQLFSKSKPSSLSALGFDAYMILLDSISRANSFNKDKINEQIRKTANFPGATGFITIDKNGDTIKSVTMVRIENGKFVYDSMINP